MSPDNTAASASTSPAVAEPVPAAPETAQEQPATSQESYLEVLMERNFLRRAMNDLNFHDNAHDGILYLDLEGKVVYSNPYFRKMIGIEKPEALTGKPMPPFVWADADAAKEMIADVMDAGFVREREMLIYNVKGEPVFAVCSSVISRDDDGNKVGIEMMLCNITGKRKVEATLRERTAQLERVATFAASSLETLSDMISRKAPHSEMRAITRQLQNELKQIL